MIRLAFSILLLLSLAALTTPSLAAGGTCVIGDEGGTCSAGPVSMSLPAYAVPAGTRIGIESAGCSEQAISTSAAASCYAITATGADGRTLAQFGALVDVWFDGPDMARTGTDPEQVQVLTLNTGTGQWTTDNVSSPSRDARGRVHVTLAAPSRLAIVPQPNADSTMLDGWDYIRVAEGTVEWVALGLGALLLGLGIIHVLRHPIAG